MIPPTSTDKYIPENALDDLPAIKYASDQFLNSQMIESEEFCLKIDPRKERLYITSGYSLIQCVKAIMSYEDSDLQVAHKIVKHGNDLAIRHRAPSPPIVSRIAGLVWDNSATGVGFFKSMTPVQRHAELLYAETTFAKALLGVICSGSWLSFISEALSFRSMINTYLGLGKYLDAVDAEAAARGEGPEDKTIDKDFRSGVELGVGASNLILSLMPNRLLAVAEIFGYTGDRDAGLKLLMKAGGWSKTSSEPEVGVEEEGLRRPLADICMLCFHLVISSVTYKGVDLRMAQTILEWNLKRFPNGVFYLFGQGRIRVLRSQPGLAIESYEQAMAVQTQYRSLYYISFWEIAICSFSTWDIEKSLNNWRLLEAEATWSKASYTYGTAACLLQLGGEERTKEAESLLQRIPKLIHKIAGKSIPIEKFVARKARKFQSQGRRLLLPALEFAYMFLAVDHSPRGVIWEKILPEVEETRRRIVQFVTRSSSYEGGHGYWDDYCLIHFLEGVCLRFVAYPDKEAVVDDYSLNTPQDEIASNAVKYLTEVIEKGINIELDHYILYNAHYELGRLYVCMSNIKKAKEHLDLVLSGKPLERDPSTRKGPFRKQGKYSMQSALMLRATAVMEALDQRANLS